MRKLSNILLILLFPFFINCGKGIIALFEDTNNVKEPSVYVSISGDDSNPGTLHSPLKTIQAGIDLAKEKSYANVLVTGGEYSSQGTVFTLAKGVSLYGGYSDDFSSRDDVTIVINSLTTGGQMSNPHKTIYSSPTVDALTVIDGFTIMGSGGLYSMALYLDDSSPIIQNCRVIGGAVSERSIAIFNSNSSNALIKNCIVEAGSSQLSYSVYYFLSYGRLENSTILGQGGSLQSVAVMLEESKDVEISNNTINGGTGHNSYGLVFYKNSSGKAYGNCVNGGKNGETSTGIFIDNSDGIILNNTIDGGAPGDYSIGIHIFNKLVLKNVSIANNIVFTSNALYRFGILEEGEYSYPTFLKSNNVFNCPDGLYISYDGFANYYLSDMNDVNLLENRSASENINLDPIFEDLHAGNWHFTDFSSPLIKSGGINLIDEGFEVEPFDKDGKPRPASGTPWSIGAYE